jgi:ferredoxin
VSERPDGELRLADLPRRRDLRRDGSAPPPLGFHEPPAAGPAVPRLSTPARWESATSGRRRPGPTLRVDWPMCRAHGLCAEVLPEAVRLDEWGYPILDGAVPLVGELLDGAKRAVQACPTLALRLLPPR